MRSLLLVILGVFCQYRTCHVSSFQLVPATRSKVSFRLEDDVTSGRTVKHPLKAQLRPTEESGEASKSHNSIKEDKSNFSAQRFCSSVVLASTLLLGCFLADPTPQAWAAEAPTATESTLLQPSTKQNELTVVEEVWNLVNKYYIDRNFNGQVRLIRSIPQSVLTVGILRRMILSRVFYRIGMRLEPNTSIQQTIKIMTNKWNW
jgi:hypothetical protein